jgi:hypothetical protein
MMKKTVFSTVFALLASCVWALLAVHAAPADSGDRAEIQALRQQLDELKKSAYHPELGEQMLILQIRHARLWFAGEAGNWNLATFQVQELQEAFDAVVEQNPDDANLQPERLADVLPAMTRGPIADLRKAVDAKSKVAFEKAFDGLSAACTACHRVAGNEMLVIQRPKTPLLDNLPVAPAPAK